MHARGNVRGLIKTHLSTSTSFEDRNIFSNRAPAFEADQFPTLNITSNSESQEDCKRRELRVNVEIRCSNKGTTKTIDDVGDELSEEIENLMNTANIPGVLIYYEGMTSDISAESDRFINTIDLSYRVRFSINPKDTSEILGA